jgi:uncharacterized membrane protein
VPAGDSVTMWCSSHFTQPRFFSTRRPRVRSSFKTRLLPLGLFIGAVVFDAIYLWRGSSTIATVGYWNIAGGIVGGLLAALFGLIDWLAIPAGTRAKAIGLWHAGSNVLAILGFAFVWWTRYSGGHLATTSGLFTIEVVALLFGAVGGWLGGELVDRLGVGVDSGANLDAPNSMAGKRPRAA